MTPLTCGRKRVTRPIAKLPALLAVWALGLAAVGLTPAPAVAESTLPPEKLPALAESGDFDELLTRLKRDYGSRNDGAVRSLIDDLERYRQHRAQDAEQRRQARDEALTQAEDAFNDENLEEALVSVIDAHDLTDQPDAMLERPMVAKVVSRARQAARQAQESGQWIKALSLYRLLDLLHDERSAYRAQLEEARRHVRVLRVYAPDRLQTLYAKRRKARAEDQANGQDDEPSEDGVAPDAGDEPANENPAEDGLNLPTIDDEPWQKRLNGVAKSMLRNPSQFNASVPHRRFPGALGLAANQHIGDHPYDELMQGAIEAVLVMARTKALSDTFAGLDDEKQRREFLDFLERRSASLKNPDKSLSYGDAGELIDRVMLMNDRTVDLPDRVLIFEMTEGLIGKLDEFSGVVWPEQISELKRATEGKFFGVGIQISRRNGRLVVVSPLANTPAQRAGIKAGDIIAEVNGQDTSNWSLDKAVRKITGPEGTEVTLGIERRGEPELIEYDIRRAEIEIESIRGWKHTADGGWRYYIEPDNRIGYVRVSQFNRDTPDDLDAAIQQMRDNGPINGLILDLRFNPGGLLSAAVDVADRFINEGPIVFTVNGQGDRTNESRAKQHRTYQPFPVVVLVNQGSASASEIVSGALQDYDRAVVIGSRSFGKGSVQDVLPLGRGKAYLKLTTHHYMLPRGRIIHRQPDDKTWGIEPDLTIDMTDQQVADSIEFRQKVDVLRSNDAKRQKDEPEARQILKDGLDPQLEAALLVIKTQLTARHIAMNDVPQQQANSQ